MTDKARIDAVVIGRNEGDRLLACLRSLTGQVHEIVYVDSGSTDGSVEHARDLGATVVELDLTRPFTAARARNAGIAQLPPGDFVQLVDGDCTVDPSWVATAATVLSDQPKVAVVCGRRREQAPQDSVYNRLCDREWDTPVGEILACGGDAMMRREALRQVGGYRDDLIAGEEPELCVRLRQEGWTIQRINAEMTRHDARIMRFSQWWQRSRRAGFAFAEGAALHGAPPERHWVRETQRALVWGAALPVAAVVSAVLHPMGWALLLLYPAQVLRLSRRLGLETAFFTVVAKFPEAQGALEFLWHKRRASKRGLIEYK
ncbi:glycosyltransferase [Aliisedimentitalea scapharcae]|uniref:Glycosyltransferase n=1 Tax=Aliisedimentitalea scapharcae TaxID=1524259 RepID=A0ABZ2XV89_9RHOB